MRLSRVAAFAAALAYRHRVTLACAVPQYINMAEENETANTAMHKVAISAWTFTTMRTAGIDKRALPRRVRKALMIYMFMVRRSVQ